MGRPKMKTRRALPVLAPSAQIRCDPLRLDAREALTRYDAAVATTRAAMPLVADLELEVQAAMQEAEVSR